VRGRPKFFGLRLCFRHFILLWNPQPFGDYETMARLLRIALLCIALHAGAGGTAIVSEVRI